jgi:hypothetical protein
MLNKRLISIGIGSIFLLTAIFATGYSFINKDYTQVLWMCYSMLALIGIGIAIGNTRILASQLNIILVPFIIWNIDFFHILIFSEPLWGITNYFFESDLIIPKTFTLQHIFTLPLAFVYLYIMKLEKKDAWKISISQVTILFFATLYLSEPTRNLNCAFESCMPFIPTNSFYPLIWFMVVFSGIFITNYILVSIPFFKKLKSQVKQNSRH